MTSITTAHQSPKRQLDASALAGQLGLADKIVDSQALENSVALCAKNKVVLPTFAQLADPSKIDADYAKGVDNFVGEQIVFTNTGCGHADNFTRCGACKGFVSVL